MGLKERQQKQNWVLELKGGETIRIFYIFFVDLHLLHSHLKLW